MPLNGQIGVHAMLNLSPVAADPLSSTASAQSYFKNWDITSGVGANQADQRFTMQRTVAGGANDDVDLTGTLVNALGGPVAFVKVKAVIIEALATNTTNLTVGNATAPFVGWFGAAAHTIILKPGDFFAIASPGAAGWAVTATTADLLRVTNAAGAAALYNITIVGTTA
jgi:hypothetical protein